LLISHSMTAIPWGDGGRVFWAFSVVITLCVMIFITLRVMTTLPLALLAPQSAAQLIIPGLELERLYNLSLFLRLFRLRLLGQCRLQR
jgi:hypothetical protein